MNILHIASFQGNIGDNASHLGFYSILNRLIKSYSVEKIEMRKFYKNYNGVDNNKFDKDFICYLNRFDLCVVGGGGFLDYWVPGSKTGTTFDVDPNLISQIKKPTLFTSIGCNPQKHVPDENVDKFKRFLGEVNENENTRVAVRNDGSVESIKRDIGKEYLKDIVEILDHGFFYDSTKSFCEIVDKKYVAINISNDQLGMRSALSGMENKEEYLSELNKVVVYIVTHLKLNVLFVPHIYSDLKAISEFLEIAEDGLIRNHITVAPCVQGDTGAEYIFSLYKNSEFVVGTRLHANVCSIAMGKKTIGLAALDRVEYLYKSLGINNRSVKLSSGFSEKIVSILDGDSFSEVPKLGGLRDTTVEYYENILGNL
jgi:polysaccharide pyruvyl transferase WcaK-like protein